MVETVNQHVKLPIAWPDEAIAGFCERWKIKSLALFGSIWRPDFHAQSDVDVLVTFDGSAAPSLLDHVTMQDELGVVLGRKVDLHTRRGVERSRNALRRRAILEGARVVHGS